MKNEKQATCNSGETNVGDGGADSDVFNYGYDGVYVRPTHQRSWHVGTDGGSIIM